MAFTVYQFSQDKFVECQLYVLGMGGWSEHTLKVPHALEKVVFWEVTVQRS